jgi:hypothetical protein
MVARQTSEVVLISVQIEKIILVVELQKYFSFY